MHSRALLHLLSDVSPDEPIGLPEWSRRAGWSRFHLHRALRAALGETPKQFNLRVRLERAAAALIATEKSVLDIALAAGFASHAVFTRAFRRRFGCAPMRYRAMALAGASSETRDRHAALTAGVGPCVGLFRLALQPSAGKAKMATLSISRKDLAAQPILLIRRRITRAELPPMLGECFGKLYAHGQKAGLPIAGWPLARYVSMGPGLWTVEAAMPVAASVAAEGEMQPGVLPAGPVAMGVHAGPYEQLPETFAAMERWIEASGFRIGGSPWESYVTDPAQHPNPADWRTEVYWPLTE
jgi:AraC family transcriptional regulator